MQLFHSVADGYDSVSATCLSLLAAGRRALLSWRGSSQGAGSRSGAGPSDTLTSLAFHSSFAVLRLAFLWLLTSVLLRNYRRARAELYRPAVDLQDYEMVELFLRRLKMWMGLSRAKEVSLYIWLLLCFLSFFGKKCVAHQQCKIYAYCEDHPHFLPLPPPHPNVTKRIING